MRNTFGNLSKVEDDQMNKLKKKKKLTQDEQDFAESRTFQTKCIISILREISK